MHSRLRQLKDFFSSGPRRAEDYLNLCLHQPNFGYYQVHAKVGARGDFSTAATMGTGLSRAIAAWIAANLNPSARTNVLEVGPGNGQLALQVSQALRWQQRRRLRHHLVDSSPVLTTADKQSLGIPAHKNSRSNPLTAKFFQLHRSMESALLQRPETLLIYSNELVDAFAPVILQWNGQGWDELGLKAKFQGSEMSLAETPLPLSAERQQQLACQSLNPANWPEGWLKPGQRIEIPHSYRTWLTSWLAPLRAKSSNSTKLRMLTIDYGEEFPQLYQGRPRGTLRGYFAQQRLTGAQVWQRAGRQDLTFDVNFSTLAAWHQELGLSGKTHNLAAWLEKKNILLEPNDPLHQAAAHFQVREDWLEAK